VLARWTTSPSCLLSGFWRTAALRRRPAALVADYFQSAWVCSSFKAVLPLDPSNQSRLGDSNCQPGLNLSPATACDVRGRSDCASDRSAMLSLRH